MGRGRALTPAQLAADYIKAVGADHLVELLEEQPPRTFILFSSAAATWGGVRQGAYAAANAHLDALAARVRLMVIPARCRWRGGCGPTTAMPRLARRRPGRIFRADRYQRDPGRYRVGGVAAIS